MERIIELLTLDDQALYDLYKTVKKADDPEMEHILSILQRYKKKEDIVKQFRTLLVNSLITTMVEDFKNAQIKAGVIKKEG